LARKVPGSNMVVPARRRKEDGELIDINRLRDRIQELEQELDNRLGDLAYDHAEAQARLNQRLRAAQGEADRLQRESQNQEYERYAAVRDLERAKTSGDSYAEEKALRRLSRGW